MNGASTLPLRLRIQANTTPAAPVASVAPPSATAWPARPFGSKSPAGLVRIMSSVGNKCHRPNRVEVHAIDVAAECERESTPSSTPRKTISSGSAVANGIRTPTSYAAAAELGFNTRSSAKNRRVFGTTRAAPTRAAETSDDRMPTSRPRRTWARPKPRSDQEACPALRPSVVSVMATARLAGTCDACGRTRLTATL
jgi:hypothetical protein